ncbi:MAG: GNAT family N-acetyltransferase [Treponema sp.]|nr:GNAT family N-acetyltransferase [Treponema sp.]
MSLKSGVEILVANFSDLEPLYVLETAAFTSGNSARKEAFEYRLENFPQWFFKAVFQGKIVGFLNGCSSGQELITDDLYAPGAPYDERGENFLVFGLVVREDFRRLGVASDLLRMSLCAAKARGKTRAALTCEECLIPFYEKFGFKNRGVSKSVVGGIKYYDMGIVL